MMFFSRLKYYLTSIPTLINGFRTLSLLKAFSIFATKSESIIELRNNYRFYVRTIMDIWIIKETILDRQYERASVYIQNGWRVIDIGAGFGDFAIDIAIRNPECVVFAYEPLPESLNLLIRNQTLNKVKNIKAFPLAISGRNGSINLNFVSREPTQQSTAYGFGEHSIRVPCITLDGALNDIALETCDYLKLDCEGAEYEILFNTSDETFRKIRHICLEFHDGITKYSHEDLRNFLEQKRFSVKITPNPAWEHLGYLHASNLDMQNG